MSQLPRRKIQQIINNNLHNHNIHDIGVCFFVKLIQYTHKENSYFVMTFFGIVFCNYSCLISLSITVLYYLMIWHIHIINHVCFVCIILMFHKALRVLKYGPSRQFTLRFFSPFFVCWRQKQWISHSHEIGRLLCLTKAPKISTTNQPPALCTVILPALAHISRSCRCKVFIINYFTRESM